MSYSLDNTFKNLNINLFKDHFIKFIEFSLNDILKFYQIENPAIKKTTVQWRVSRLLDLEIIQRIGRGKYSIGKHKMFKPSLTPQIKKIYDHLVMEFSNSKYCIWSTEWLKGYLPEMEVQITFVEGVGKQPSSFFFHLWEKRDGTVWWGLSERVTKTFGKKQTIVKKMISGSPLIESEGIFYAHLEKIIVDLYCDWNFIYPYEKPTFHKLLKKLYKDFSINESKLLRYASRRKKKEIFIKILKRLRA